LEVQLKRSLTLPLLTLYGLGTILGAGVYVLIGKVAGVAGIYAPIAFLVSAVIAAFTGFSYAQLSSRYPRSAGEALYVSKAFSLPALSTCVGWFVITTGVVSAAT
jgi:amino acid transporter